MEQLAERVANVEAELGGGSKGGGGGKGGIAGAFGEMTGGLQKIKEVINVVNSFSKTSFLYREERWRILARQRVPKPSAALPRTAGRLPEHCRKLLAACRQQFDPVHNPCKVLIRNYQH